MISLLVFDTDMPRVAFFVHKTKTDSDFLVGGRVGRIFEIKERIEKKSVLSESGDTFMPQVQAIQHTF